MTFNLRSFIIFIALFLIEVCIALFLKSGFIGFVYGDFLVVIMLFYFAKSFVRAKALNIAMAVLIFAFIIEFLQLTNLLELFGLEKNKLANLIFGNTFGVTDLIAYSLGIICVLIIEKKSNRKLILSLFKLKTDFYQPIL